MSLILDRDEPEPPIQTERNNLIQFPPELFGIVRTPWRTWAAAEISSSAAHKRAVREGRSRRVEANADDPSDADGFLPAKRADAAERAAVPALTLLTDVLGSPSESRCSKSQLKNILAVRDEQEAAEARRTVRLKGE